MKLNVFFSPKQSTDAAATGFSPSAKKPAELIKFWEASEEPVQILSDWQPIIREQYYQVHDQKHVDAVLDCKKQNGFLTVSEEISATLPFTSGSFLAASLSAYRDKTVAMSPTSGFHHATYNECMGFCTFNGLMVTALELLKGGAGKVGILDLDHHYGNGTDDIIDLLQQKGELSANQIYHYTVGGDTRFNKVIGKYGGRDLYGWKGGDTTEKWLQCLPGILSPFLECDIVLFQAGADPHVNDPCHAMIGCEGALTNEQFAERDRTVFETLAQEKIPVAWNLAGGYQTPLQNVLDIHTQTLHECLRVLPEYH